MKRYVTSVLQQIEVIAAFIRNHWVRLVLKSCRKVATLPRGLEGGNKAKRDYLRV